MKKELHIWMSDNYINQDKMHFTLHSTQNALKQNEKIVHTTQTHFCSTTLLAKGYKIFVHMIDGEMVEIKLGQCCEREIRLINNLEKMLLANVFGKATI